MGSYTTYQAGTEFFFLFPRFFIELFLDIIHIHQAGDAGHHNKHVAIYSNNSYSWMVIDLALMGYIGPSVGFSKDWLEYDTSNAINVSKTDIVFYGKNKSQVVIGLKKKHRKVLFICIEDELSKLLSRGRAVLNNRPKLLEKHIQSRNYYYV